MQIQSLSVQVATCLGRLPWACRALLMAAAMQRRPTLWVEGLYAGRTVCRRAGDGCWCGQYAGCEGKHDHSTSGEIL